MIEYTYKDIIIDPTNEEAKNAIGKKCYMYDSPTMLLKMANSDDGARTLESIDESDYPFNDKEFGSEWTCIIVKKEEPKPQYVPFKSKEEFIEAYHYHDNANYSEIEDILMNYGMWLKDKNSHEIFLVTGVFNQSIHICDFDSDESWGELLNEFTFIDGSPCGKLMEVKDL